MKALLITIISLSIQVQARSRGGGGIYSFTDGGTSESRFTDTCESDKEVRNNYREVRKKLKNGKSSQGFFGEYTDATMGTPVTFYFYSNQVDCNKGLEKAKAKTKTQANPEN